MTIRLLPTPRVAALLATLTVAAAAVTGTGFGAADADRSVSTNVLSAISLQSPSALGGAPQVCTRAFAPVDADACEDVGYSTGTVPVLSLGSLAGSDVQAGAATWRVTTSNPTGYTLQLSQSGTGATLKSDNAAIPDMPTSPAVPADAVDDSTHFGVAVGDAGRDNQAAVAYPESPWVGRGGSQGELYRGIPASGLVVARRTAPQQSDPVRITFAAASVIGELPRAGAYTGSVVLTASTI